MKYHGKANILSFWTIAFVLNIACTSAQSPKKNLNIVFIGNSITYGANLEHPETDALRRLPLLLKIGQSKALLALLLFQTRATAAIPRLISCLIQLPSGRQKMPPGRLATNRPFSFFPLTWVPMTAPSKGQTARRWRQRITGLI